MVYMATPARLATAAKRHARTRVVAGWDGFPVWRMFFIDSMRAVS